MTTQSKGFMNTGLPPWLVLVLSLIVLSTVVAFGLVLRWAFAPTGDQPVVTETRIPEPDASAVLIKRVQRFKDGSTEITLAIGGARSLEEPFALYADESRSEFHWDNGKLDACVQGARFTDRSYWLDHVDLPDGGEVQIVKTCPIHAGLMVSPGKSVPTNLGTPS